MTETQDRPDDRRVAGGVPATWTVGEKYGFTTLGDHDAPNRSRVWFTLTEGALTEARFPRLDLVSVRLVEFVVSDPDSEYAARTYRADGVDYDVYVVVDPHSPAVAITTRRRSTRRRTR